LTKTINVVCAIIEKDGRFLAARRGGAQPHAGFWEFPGGKINPGEDAEKALVREIKEELGIDISIIKQLPPVTFDYPGKSVTLIPFICAMTSGTPQPLEHGEIRWLDSRESALALAWLPPDAEILKNYLSSSSVRCP
jgi:8-oxo-dGTP diphosphatase